MLLFYKEEVGVNHTPTKIIEPYFFSGAFSLNKPLVLPVVNKKFE